MPESRVLLSVSWADSTPFLRLRDDDEPVSRLEPVAGLALNFRTSKETERVCVGHIPFRSSRGVYHDCLKAPQAGSRTCERCGIVEATFASNLHHAHTRGMAELDPAIREHLQQPNRLYLAIFRDGSLKVGTSTLNRSQKRLEEQGAWMARYVAQTDDGIIVRRLEDEVTEQLGLGQAVAATRKVKGMVSPRSDVELASMLDDAAAAVAPIVRRSDDPRVAAFDEEWRHPMADHPATERVHRYPIKLADGSHDLEIVTAVGRVVLARRPGSDDVFALDPAPLFGLKLPLGNYGSDEIVIQDSLF